jgi:hypothetical protein
MAGGKLTVEIGADKTDFDKKIKEVEFDIKELSKVKLEQLKVGLDTTQINAQIKDAKASLNSLKTTVKDTGSTFTGMAPKVANGGNALMQFSRIAQDAPYGIIGIGNNITATVEAFGHLKNSTGSTGGALKALAGSLMGSGGILLGVSLLTTGLTYMAQSGLTVGDVIDKLTGETNAYSDALKKATSEAYTNQSVVQAAEDVKQLTNEVQLAKDGFLNKNKVVEHYNDTMGKTTGIVKTLDEVEQQLVKNGAAYIQMMLYKATATLAQGEAAKELLKRENLSKNETQKHLGVLEYFLIASGQSVNIITAMSGAEKNRKEAVNGSTQAMNANLSVAEKYNKLAAEIAKSKGFNFFGDNETKKAKPTFVTPQVQGLLPMVSAPLVDVNTIAVFNGQIDALGGKVKELPGVIKASLAMLPEEVSASLVAMTQALMDFNTKAGEIISGALVNTFAGIGAAIGGALASGGNVLKAIGGSLLSSLGGLLTDMGKMAIQVGVGLLAIKTALKSLNPAVAIGAGVALIALGSFFSSKSSSIGGSVGGGGRGASSSSGSGANNQSFTSSGFSGGGNNGGTVVFEIAGQKLIGVLSNTLNANRRLGGQLGL